MQFREATLENRQQVEDLWDCCFEKKGDPFFKFYFGEYCWRQNRVFGAFEDGRLACMLHVNPYVLKLRDMEERVPYVVGVATAPEARGRHLMGELLQYALEQVRSEGCHFVTLMPVYAGIYLPYEFAFCYERAKYSWERGKLSLPYDEAEQFIDVREEAVEPSEELQRVLAIVYDTAMVSKYQGVPKRAAEDWQKLLTSHAAEHVQVALAYLGGQCVGYLLYYVEKDTLHLLELVAYNPRIVTKLLHYADTMPVAKRVEWLAEPEDRMYLDFADADQAPQRVPFMMARCVHIGAAFQRLMEQINGDILADRPMAAKIFQGIRTQLAAHLHKESITFGFMDNLLQENNVWVNLTVKDKYELTYEVVDSETADMPDIIMDAGAFTQLYFGYATVQELFERGKIANTTEDAFALELLERIFTPESTWINEYF